MGRRFGRAHVQYGDWQGTISLDDPQDEGELYRLAGVDQDAWLICGISIDGAAGMGISASVYAVRREAIHEFSDWERIAQGNVGAIPVMEFELREGTALALLGTFKLSSIHATLRDAIENAGLDLEVVETVHPPEA